MYALLDELTSPTANYRGQLILATSWISQCLMRLLGTDVDHLDTNIKKARKKNLIDGELARALEALLDIRDRAAHRELAHHEIFLASDKSDPLAVIGELRVGYDDLERLTNEHQLVFQFALAVLLHLTGPADHPDSASLPVRLIWRP